MKLFFKIIAISILCVSLPILGLSHDGHDNDKNNKEKEEQQDTLSQSGEESALKLTSNNEEIASPPL